MLTADTDR